MKKIFLNCRYKFLIMLILLALSGTQTVCANAFNGKGIFSFDFSYMGVGLKNNGWGFGLAYEHGVTNFSSVKGSFSHITLKPDSNHDWITTVGLDLNARIYPFNQGMKMLYFGYGIRTDFLMFNDTNESITYISHCPHIGWKQNFLDYVMLDAYFGYRMKATEADDFALRSGIIKQGVEYGISLQINLHKLLRLK